MRQSHKILQKLKRIQNMKLIFKLKKQQVNVKSTLKTIQTYITIKDHKDNYKIIYPCRLINPDMTKNGKIKKLLNKINQQLKVIVGIKSKTYWFEKRKRT